MSEEFKSEISSTDTEEEGGKSLEEKLDGEGKEEDIVNKNENATNVGEMLVKFDKLQNQTKPNLLCPTMLITHGLNYL